MTISVCGPRVLVKQDKLEDVNPAFKRAKEAGLAIPDGREVKLEQRALDRGVVVRIGPLAWKDWDDGAPWCCVGERVLYARHAGKVVKESEESDDEYVILNDEDIIAVITED